MDVMEIFEEEKRSNIKKMSEDHSLIELSQKWFIGSSSYRYSYHFTWLGRPIIQFPQDMVAMQEIIWRVNPELIVETGIAHGGSLIFYASILELLGGKGSVLGIDIDIRKHNRVEIEKHPMYKRITMIEGSSLEQEVVDRVVKLAHGKKPVMVVLDANHTHEHVLREMQLYSPSGRPGQLFGRVRHCGGRYAGGFLPGPRLGQGKQSEDGRARVLAD